MCLQVTKGRTAAQGHVSAANNSSLCAPNAPERQGGRHRIPPGRRRHCMPCNAGGDRVDESTFCAAKRRIGFLTCVGWPE